MSGPEEAPLYPSDAGRTVAGSPEEVIAEALAGTLQAELALSALKAAGYLVIGPDAETRERMEEAGAAVWVREHEERFGRAVTNPSYRAFVLSRFALALTAALAASLEEQ